MDNRYVDVGGHDGMEERRSIKVGVTEGDGVEIAVERYMARFASIINKGGAEVLNLDLKNGHSVKIQAGNVQKDQPIAEFLENRNFVLVLHGDEEI